jgi:hypothetical protein
MDGIGVTSAVISFCTSFSTAESSVDDANSYCISDNKIDISTAFSRVYQDSFGLTWWFDLVLG